MVPKTPIRANGIGFSGFFLESHSYNVKPYGKKKKKIPEYQNLSTVLFMCPIKTGMINTIANHSEFHKYTILMRIVSPDETFECTKPNDEY